MGLKGLSQHCLYLTVEKLAYGTAEIDQEPKYPNFEVGIRADERH